MKSKIVRPLMTLANMPPLVGFRASGESTYHGASNLKLTLVSVKVMAINLLAKKKLRERYEVTNLGGSPTTMEVFKLELCGYSKMCIVWSVLGVWIHH